MRIVEWVVAAWVALLVVLVTNVFLPLGIHWPLASGEWAAWISGLGSVAAAVAAVGIATQTQRQQRREARAALNLLVDSSTKVVRGIYSDARPNERLSAARAKQLEIQVLLSFGQKIEVGRLREDEARVALTVLQTLAHFASVTEERDILTYQDVAAIQALAKFFMRHSGQLH